MNAITQNGKLTIWSNKMFKIDIFNFKKNKIDALKSSLYIKETQIKNLKEQIKYLKWENEKLRLKIINKKFNLN